MSLEFKKRMVRSPYIAGVGKLRPASPFSSKKKILKTIKILDFAIKTALNSIKTLYHSLILLNLSYF